MHCPVRAYSTTATARPSKVRTSDCLQGVGPTPLENRLRAHLADKPANPALASRSLTLRREQIGETMSPKCGGEMPQDHKPAFLPRHTPYPKLVSAVAIAAARPGSASSSPAPFSTRRPCAGGHCR